MNQTDTRVAQRLRDEGLLDQFQYQSVLDRLAESGGRLHMAVLELGLVQEKKLFQIVGEVCGLPLASLARMRIDAEAATRLAAEFCDQHCVYPCSIRNQGKTLWLAMADPTDVSVINAARQQSRLEVRPLLALPSEIREHIRTAYRGQLEAESPYVAGAIDLSLEPGEDEEEFKITDLAGKTMIRHAKDVAESAAAASPTGPDPAQLQKLNKLLANQLKAERIIQGLARLLAGKGLLSTEEYTRLTSRK